MRKQLFCKGKRQSQQNNSCLKVSFISSENTLWLEHLSSLNPEGQKVEKRKVSATPQLSPEWGNHTESHCCDPLKRIKEGDTANSMPSSCSQESLFYFGSCSYWLKSSSTFPLCLLIYFNIYSHLHSSSYTYMSFTLHLGLGGFLFVFLFDFLIKCVMS